MSVVAATIKITLFIDPSHDGKSELTQTSASVSQPKGPCDSTALDDGNVGIGCAREVAEQPKASKEVIAPEVAEGSLPGGGPQQVLYFRATVLRAMMRAQPERPGSSCCQSGMRQAASRRLQLAASIIRGFS